jgi:hypothetical protein
LILLYRLVVLFLVDKLLRRLIDLVAVECHVRSRRALVRGTRGGAKR